MKWAAKILAVVLVLIGLSISTAAQSNEIDLQPQMDAVGADELMDKLPENAQDLLGRTGIDKIDYKQLLTLSPADFFKEIWRLVLEKLKEPMTTFCAVLGTVILCALLDSLKTSLWEGNLSTVFSAVAAVCIATAVATPIINCITTTAGAIQDCSNFILAFVPVFSSVVTAAGQPVTATTYTVFLFGACQIVSQIVSNIFVPLMGIYLAFCMVGSLTPGINIVSVAKVIKSTVSWGLGLLLTLFVGLLSMQTMVASGSDTVVAKTAKFLIGSFVPIVGSALSEAFAATQGYLKLLKATVGVFGTLVAALTFLPIFLQTIIWYLTVNITAAISDMLGIKQVGDILKSSASVLSILLAISLCFALLVIVSTSLVLMASTGV